MSWQSSFGEDKNLLTVPGIEKRLLSRAPLSTVTTPNKASVHTALLFLEGASALTVGEDRGQRVADSDVYEEPQR